MDYKHSWIQQKYLLSYSTLAGYSSSEEQVDWEFQLLERVPRNQFLINQDSGLLTYL
jgi:hypothetical protein